MLKDTPATVYSEIVVNLTTTGEPRRSSSNDSSYDIIAEFLEKVEEYERNKENCKPGTQFNLGKGVIQQYGINRFKRQALVAVNRANFLTRIWKTAPQEVLDSEYLFYTQVRNFVEGDHDIFAAGNCYDYREYKGLYLFCPFAYRTENGTINVKDLSIEYDYLGNTSEWFYEAKKHAANIDNFNITYGTAQWRYNDTSQSIPEMDTSITVTYDDGHWSIPYFDCGGGFIWMMTYTVPFFGYRNGTFKFKGTSGIDIDLQKVDIDQCPNEPGEELNVFANSARCKNATTKCVPISGLGFRRGSYKCVCKDGFYFPNTKDLNKYYNGSEIEIRYREKIYGESDYYDKHFECLPCADGCDVCEDDSPCVITLNWSQRSVVLAVSALIMCCIPALIWFTVQYRDIKVLKAASPVLLRIILLGAFLLYCPLIVSYFEASVLTCCLRFWFREIGFSISYGALLLKTWRISVVFRVRSAQRIKISDTDLIKRLIIISLLFAVYSVARTVAGTPRVVQGKHVSGLKAFQCSSDWWDHSAAIAELLFLLWGIRLCIVVRKAPSEFNESRFISWAIYNETLLSLFLNVSMIFLQDPFPANPDLLYLVIFIHSNLTTTVTLAFLFGSKAYLVYKYRGKNNEVQHTTMMSKGGGSRHMYGNKQTTMNTDTLTSNANSFVDKYVEKSANDGESESLLEKDIQEEFRRLYTQLETLKQRNMKIGNRHLQHKLSAMTEAAQKDDSPDESRTGTPNMNGKRVIINLDDFKESTTL
ncbi:probable G-protein coupled receptor CG31760 [Ruditapes philippinarum]|uniref:probable G-protein coupled receptor CG31760 n=1 Tax=Ruditapes philippinarum TaxID=129788 RepID=UPI00295AAEEE|nr:probable G-protein coupled receptor CG31760 [Ruditapes philippinarum]